MRLDVALVEQKIYSTRTRAAAAIDAGLVSVNGVTAKKPSQNVAPDDVLSAGALPYVSGRGSLKLNHALEQFKIDVTGFTCLDIGASTGGFTEALLNHGASHVIAVEVGSNQMVPELKNDARVLSMEETDIRDVFPNARPNLVVIDVSFIPLSDIATAVAAWKSPRIIALIKPQFEVDSMTAKKAHGIIKSDIARQFAIKNATNAFENCGYKRVGLTPSPILGGSGNTEYLALFTL